MEIESRLMVARGEWEKGEFGVIAKGYGVSFGGDENVLQLDTGDGCITL